MWSLAKRLAPTEAEDAAQDIFIDLWKNAWRFREGIGSEAAFISTLARRRLIDRRRRGEKSPRPISLETAIPDGKGDPQTMMEAAEDLEQVRRCLATLQDRQREAVELSIYEGLTQSEISERLDAPLGTVKTLIRRGLIQIRDCFWSRRRPALIGGAV